MENSKDDERAGGPVFLTHDTPPPIIIGEGSFFVEVDEKYEFKEKSVGGNKKRRAIEPPSDSRRYKFHFVRILCGNGATYDNGNAAWHPSPNCEILIYSKPERGADSQIRSACEGEFFVEYEPAEDLRHKGKGNHSKRDHYRHMKSNDDTRITRVRVTDDTHNYDIRANDLPGGKWDDFQLMLWIEEIAV